MKPFSNVIPPASVSDKDAFRLFLLDSVKVSFQEVINNCAITNSAIESLGCDEHFPCDMDKSISCWRGILLGKEAYCVSTDRVEFIFTK